MVSPSSIVTALSISISSKVERAVVNKVGISTCNLSNINLVSGFNVPKRAAIAFTPICLFNSARARAAQMESVSGFLCPIT